MGKIKAEIGHDPAEADVVDALGIKDGDQLAVGGNEVVTVAEDGICASLGFVMKDQSECVSEVTRAARQILHLAVDTRAWLGVRDSAPRDDLTVSSAGVDRHDEIAAAVANPAVEIVLGPNVVIPPVESSNHGDLCAELTFELFYCGDVGLAVNRFGESSEAHAIGRRIRLGRTVKDCPSGDG